MGAWSRWLIGLGVWWLAGVGSPARAVGGQEVGVVERLGGQVPVQLSFRDESGRPVRLGDRLDRPVLLNLVYFRCPGLSRALLAGLRAGLETTGLEPGRDYRVVTVSFDPTEPPSLARRRKSDQLRLFSQSFPADAWDWLTGEAEAIDALARAVGFRYQRQGMGFIHPGVLIVVAPGGRICRYLPFDDTFRPFDIQLAVHEAAAAGGGPVVARVLTFCYRYDPDRHAYVFELLKVTGALSLGLVGAWLLGWVGVSRARRWRPDRGAEISPDPSDARVDRERGQGLASWVWSTDPQRIAWLYLFCIAGLVLVTVGVGLMMPFGLLLPGRELVAPAELNALFPGHGMILIFLVVVPGVPTILGNGWLPIQLGARNVAYPRLNRLAWWGYLAGAGLSGLALFTDAGGQGSGWLFRLTDDGRVGPDVPLAVLAVFTLGVSGLLTGWNVVITVHRSRVPGMGWFRLPLFVWSVYSAAWVQLVATPGLAVLALLVMLEQAGPPGLFDFSRVGDSLVYHRLFWAYAHPVAFTAILPAMGVISEILPVAARKPISGYRAIVFSGWAIAGLGLLIWGHHVFTGGVGDTARRVFPLLTLLVAVPCSITVGNWAATIYQGSIRLFPPLVFSLFSLTLFVVGGLAGLAHGALAGRALPGDTVLATGALHYVLFGGVGFAMLAGLLYGFPTLSGRLYPARPVHWAGVLLFAGFHASFAPLLLQVWWDTSQRPPVLPTQANWTHLIGTFGLGMLAGGLVLLAVTLLRAWRRGAAAPANRWAGGTLEWPPTSPPPSGHFTEIPRVARDPYDFAHPANRRVGEEAHRT